MKNKVAGVGINDADYVVNPKHGETCPFYIKWTSMLARCYSKKTQKYHPTYVGSTVVSEWHIFSNFKKWMEKQDWKGKYLDKDIIIFGNKEYGPDACCFVSNEVNSLLNDREGYRGKYPQGVVRADYQEDIMFAARISMHGEHRYLGTYKSINEAEIKYLLAKADHVKNLAKLEENTRINKGLIEAANRFKIRASKILCS
jgi:hypothetical protein